MQRGDGKIKKKERKHRLRKKNVKSKRTVSITKTKRSLCQLWAFNIREGESFHSTKVNLVLNTHALQIILFGLIYVRTQHRLESLQIVSLQLASSVGRACVNLKDFRCNDSDGGSGSTSPRGGTISGGCQPALGRVKGLPAWWSPKKSRTERRPWGEYTYNSYHQKPLL